MRYRIYGVTVSSAFALPDLGRALSGGDSSGEVAIDLGGAQSAEKIDGFHRWYVKGVSRRQPWLIIGRRAPDYVLRFPGLADFDVSASGDRIVCRPAAGLAQATLSHLLVDQVLPLALTRSGHLVLHASAVHVPRLGSIGFVGPTGSGKSTLAAALGLRGCQVLTDDCLVLRSGPSHLPLAVPSYRGLRLWRDTTRVLGLGDAGATSVAHYSDKRRVRADAVRFRAATSPLRLLFVLGRRRRSGHPAVARALAHRDRLMALAPYASIMDVEDRHQLVRMFQDLSAVAAVVPVARMNIPDSARGLQQMADGVLALGRSLI